MAQVTVELRHLIDRTDFDLFDFDYDFDDPTFKKELEQHVIDYYYFYEIGQETPEAFKHVFRSRWKRIIPYFNEMYNLTLLDYDPLVNHRMTESSSNISEMINKAKGTTKGSNTGNTVSENTSNGSDTSTGTSRTSNSSDSTNSDYPQQPIGAGNYLSGATKTEGVATTTDNRQNSNNSRNNGKVTNTDNTTQESDNTSEGSTETEFQRVVEGITGTTYQELIKKHRDNIVRIPDMVINELKPCFILTY